jgi:hypothetical protein
VRPEDVNPVPVAVALARPPVVPTGACVGFALEFVYYFFLRKGFYGNMNIIIQRLLFASIAVTTSAAGLRAGVISGHPLQKVDSPLPPCRNLRRRQQRHSTQDIDCTDVLLARQSALRGSKNPSL